MPQFNDLEFASTVRAKVADAIDVGLQRMDRTGDESETLSNEKKGGWKGTKQRAGKLRRRRGRKQRGGGGRVGW